MRRTRSNQRVRKARRRIQSPSGEQIGFIPIGLGITIEKFTKSFGISRSTFHRWTKDEVPPSDLHAHELRLWYQKVKEAHEEYLESISAEE